MGRVRWGLESLGSHLVVLTSPQGHLEATEGFKQGKARSDGHFLEIPCTVREQTGLKACRPEEAGEVVQAGGVGSGWREMEGLREVVEVDSQSLVISCMWEQWTNQREVSGMMSCLF